MTEGAGSILPLIELQRSYCSVTSPLYGRVLTAVADDVAAGGACAAVLDERADDALGSALILRFLGAVHRIVLTGGAPELAAHYPSAGGSPGDDAGEAFVATVAANVAELHRTVDQPVQTNEVGRSAVLVGGFLTLARLGLPLRILEIGASAGLNLQWDRFRYQSGEWTFGSERSPVRFFEPWTDGVPPGLPDRCPVADRRGCDSNPIDPATAEGATLLRSFVWPDHLDRLTRLDAAIEVARDEPAPVTQSGAAGWLSEELAEAEPDVVTVVTHSIVFQYLEPDERRRVLATLEAAGSRAHARAPLAWLRLEPGTDRDAELRLTLWPPAREVLLAGATYHGPPVRWLDAGAGGG